MTVLIPPAIFEEEQRVLDLPMATDCSQQLAGSDGARIETGNEVASIVRECGAVGGDQVTIDAQRDAAAGKAQRHADVVGIVERKPESTTLGKSPLFSDVSAAGRWS